MAGRSGLRHLCQNGVQIAVYDQFLHILEMAAGETFDPELLTAPAPVRHLARLNGLLKSFFIHISHHQYLIRPVILNHHRHQTIRSQLELGPLHIAVQRVQTLFKGLQLIDIDQFAHIFLYEGRRSADHIGAVHRGRDFLLSEPLGSFLGQVNVILSRVIEDRLFTAGIQIFLHILLSADTSSGFYRNLCRPADFL